jgi:hypothetical protein
VPVGTYSSEGHVASAPSHCSSTSHAPVLGRQELPAGSSPSLGHDVLEPSQVSARSHTPLDGRHSVPAAATPVTLQTGGSIGDAHVIEPALHVPGSTHASPATHTVQPPDPSQARPTPQRVP